MMPFVRAMQKTDSMTGKRAANICCTSSAVSSEILILRLENTWYSSVTRIAIRIAPKSPLEPNRLSEMPPSEVVTQMVR